MFRISEATEATRRDAILHARRMLASPDDAILGMGLVEAGLATVPIATQEFLVKLCTTARACRPNGADAACALAIDRYNSHRLDGVWPLLASVAREATDPDPAVSVPWLSWMRSVLERAGCLRASEWACIAQRFRELTGVARDTATGLRRKELVRDIARELQFLIQLQLPFPPSANRRPQFRQRRQRYFRRCSAAVLAQLPPDFVPISEPVHAYLLFSPPDGGRRDLDNFLKLAFDGLVRTKCLEDDSMIRQVSARFGPCAPPDGSVFIALTRPARPAATAP